MKKTITLILTFTLLVAMLAGCSGITVVVGECTCPAGSHTTPETTVPVVTQGALKTGLSVSTKISDSTSATADAAGAAKYDVTLAAVTVDDKGVIVSCVIDSIPATVNFDNTGKVTSDVGAEVLTKNELGENYGMVAYGGAVAEWDAQVAAVAEYAVGKTVEQLKNGDIDMTTGQGRHRPELQRNYLSGRLCLCH